VKSMRLEAVRIHNFRKICEAELSDLPPEGLIVLVGPNESGKTSIAEAVAFALYGRSVRDDCSAVELIQWGRDRLEVTLSFELRGKRFIVERSVDRLGNHTATLRDLQSGSVSSGPEEVKRALYEQGLVRFEVFRDVLYLGEAPVGVARRKALVEEVTGIAALTRAASALREEIRSRERRYALLGEEMERKRAHAEKLAGTASELDALGEELKRSTEALEAARSKASAVAARLRSLRRLSDRWHKRANRLQAEEGGDLDSLRTHLEKIENLLNRERDEGIASEEDSALEAVKRGASELRAILDGYENEVRSLEAEAHQLRERSAQLQQVIEERRAEVTARKRARRRAIFLALFGIAAAAAAGAVLAAVNAAEEDLTSPKTLGALGAGALGVVLGASGFITFLARVRRLGAARRELRSVEQEAAEIKRNWEKTDEFLKDIREASDWRTAWTRLQEKNGREPLDPMEVVGRLKEAVSALARQRRAQLNQAEAAHREAQEGLRRARSQHDRLENEWREREAARQRLEDLKLEIEKLEAERRPQEQELEDHLLALELLEGTAASLRLRAGPVLAEAVRHVIGPFTGGAWREIRLDTSFNIEVFGPEKGDFLRPTELSSAARAGIDLSVAAALSALLARSADPEGCFLLLDDPFVHFDQERVRGSLEALRGLPGIPQLFVFVHRLPEGLSRTQAWCISGGVVRRFEQATADSEGTELPASPYPPWPGTHQQPATG